MINVAIINQKGGCAKTTTAVCIAEALQRSGKRVLRIDLDPQCNLSFLLGADCTGLTFPSVYDVLMRTQSAASAIQHTDQGDIISAAPALASADLTLTATGKEYRLSEALKSVSGQYDIAVIDTPPALGVLTVNALSAAAGCVIPAQADILSLQGIGQLSQTISAVRQYCNRDLKIYGILLTRYNGRAIISRDISDLMSKTAAALGTKVFETKIRECTAVREAHALRKPLFEYAPKCNAAKDYASFLEELAL